MNMKKLLTYILSLLATVSCLQEERSPEEILVPTPAQLDCSEAAFSLTSKVPAGSQKLVDECGFLVATTKDLADAVTVEGSMTENTFAAVLPERRYGTTYYICSYVTNGHGAEIRSDVRSFALDALDKYVTFGKVSPLAYDPSSKVASVGVEADIWAGVSVSEAGLCYGQSEELSLEGDYAVGARGDDGNISVDIEGIVDGEKYFVRPYILDGEYVAYGKAAEFVIPAIPVLVTSDATDVTSDGAVIAGEVVKGADILERGFMLMEGKGGVADMTEKKVVEGTIGEYTLELSELLPNQVYSYCSYAVNPAGTYYGAVKSFTTKVGLPVVASVVASSITSTSATLSAVVKSHGGETVSEVGFYYSKEEDVDIETSTKVNQRYSQDIFEIAIAELDVNTKYYVKSYAKNSAGVGYSDVENFTTSVSSPSVKTVSYSDVTSSSAVLTGLVVSDNGAAITERGFVWVKGSDTPTIDSNKLKVDGTTGEFTYTLDGLEPNQKFSFRAYAINSKGTSYGEIMNFTTVAGLAELSATRVSGVTERSATFTCTVTDHGGVTVSEVGFYYSTDENMDLSTAKKVSETYSSDSFTFSVSELEVGTTYYVKAFAVNSAGEVQNAIVSFKTVSLPPEVNTVGYSKVSATSVQLNGKVLTANGENITDRGFVWAEGGSEFEMNNTLQVLGAVGEFSGLLEGIEPNKTYVFRAYATNAKGTAYGEVMEFNINVNLPSVTTNNVTEISDNAAKSGGVITDDGGGEILAKGVVWSKKPNPTVDLQTKTEDGEGLGSFTSSLTDLSPGYTYYVRAYATNEVGTAYGDTKTFTTTGEIQSVPLEAANSFIISYPDVYSFKTVKGNSSESVGDVATAEVLWETFGTEENIETGDLIAFASYDNGTITFATADDYREGNALIAAKDASGTILWSWHIWLTDQPVEHIYPNNAGTMMDRNLGATSATPGDAGALGLLYQWGRKDPFLGAGTMEGASPKSTGMWEAPAVSDASNGTIERAIEHPTQFIFSDEKNMDWQYIPDNTRWQSEKTMYDPCPVGWRVPDEGENGIWSTAGFSKTVYDGANEGMSFDITSPATTWYPAAGHLTNHGDPSFMNGNAYYWSVAIAGEYAYSLYFHSGGGVESMFPAYRSCAYSVRCQKEGTGGGPQYDNDFSTSGATHLSTAGTANSYIVSGAGTYSIAAVMGNSYESVGSVDSAEVLWESFGTDEKVTKGDLVAGAKYEDGLIYFKTADWFREGNAVIAAKDASGTILWSWHIWLTDQPQEQIYYNNAGTMMDRNLGATSAEPGSVGALGLMYQWGRKDPFLGSSSISGDAMPKSSTNWMTLVESDYSTGTIEYAISHPTTFITNSDGNADWYYTGSNETDKTRWTSDKTIYDPCPAGWRVPDGGSVGVWSTAKGSSSEFYSDYDNSNRGIDFSGEFGDDVTIWYPNAGALAQNNGNPCFVAEKTSYLSLYPEGDGHALDFNKNGNVNPMGGFTLASGCPVRCQKEGTGGGLKYDNDFSTSGAAYLSSAGTANSYIVSSAGTYRIDPVKGNSSESVGPVESAVVLWESYGTRDHYDYINKGNLIAGARYDSGSIYFKTADEFSEGNAVIAAKDASGTILWSWHIWMTDRPEEHTYPNNAGVMMDRNLGATSAEPGAAGALGLLYQWGRKDPFLNSYAPNFPAQAPATINWPSAVTSSPSEGTIDYAVKHPTTYIYGSDYGDWCYSTSAATDVTRWQSEKTKYDPCPMGWRVPDGGDNGIWNKAGFSNTSFSSANFGTLFSITYPTTTWYPASGHIYNKTFALDNVGASGYYWSANSIENHHGAYAFEINNKDEVYPGYGNDKSFGFSVRCQKEGTGAGPSYNDDFSTLGATSLSDAGTANCYIVSGAGTYAISAVKGNSNQYIGNDVSMEVLWESFGTDETIHKGDLITGVKRGGDYIYFKTSDTFREGNAVIAAKDASGTILWSWHIWLTDHPQGQVYNNNAGTMMDRNLGATSATPGDVGALGLLYQWGRKDPFLGSSSIHHNRMAIAESTNTWPSAVSSESSTGTIEYAVEHPTTFIVSNVYNLDWYYTGSGDTDDTRWQSEKTIYDPCPVGWRVPTGGENGVWNIAGFSNTGYDSANVGISFEISSPSTTWYPTSGYRVDVNGGLTNVGYFSDYWSVTPSSSRAYDLYNNYFGEVNTKSFSNRSSGFSVRCQKE